MIRMRYAAYRSCLATSMDEDQWKRFDGLDRGVKFFHIDLASDVLVFLVTFDVAAASIEICASASDLVHGAEKRRTSDVRRRSEAERRRTRTNTTWRRVGDGEVSVCQRRGRTEAIEREAASQQEKATKVISVRPEQ